MALKYTLKTKRIEIDGPENYIEVRGLSLNDVVQLLMVNRPAIEELFSQFSGRDPETIGEADVMDAGMGMVENAPALAAHIIAMGADALDQFDEIAGVPAVLADEEAGTPYKPSKPGLPIGVQVSALEKIGELTFAAGGGPKKMLALAMKLVGKRQSRNLPA